MPHRAIEYGENDSWGNNPRRNGQVDTNLEAVLFDKLVAVGLLRQRKAVKLQAFITDYIAHRTDVKPATREIWGQGERGSWNFSGAISCA